MPSPLPSVRILMGCWFNHFGPSRCPPSPALWSPPNPALVDLFSRLWHKRQSYWPCNCGHRSLEELFTKRVPPCCLAPPSILLSVFRFFPPHLPIPQFFQNILRVRFLLFPAPFSAFLICPLGSLPLSLCLSPSPSSFAYVSWLFPPSSLATSLVPRPSLWSILSPFFPFLLSSTRACSPMFSYRPSHIGCWVDHFAPSRCPPLHPLLLLPFSFPSFLCGSTILVHPVAPSTPPSPFPSPPSESTIVVQPPPSPLPASPPLLLSPPYGRACYGWSKVFMLLIQHGYRRQLLCTILCPSSLTTALGLSPACLRRYLISSPSDHLLFVSTNQLLSLSGFQLYSDHPQLVLAAKFFLLLRLHRWPRCDARRHKQVIPVC